MLLCCDLESGARQVKYSRCQLELADASSDQIKSLPLHPLKARVMGAQYPAGSNGLRTPYRDLENIICEASVVGEKRVMVPHEQAPLITMPILFSFEDEEVVFQDRNESRTLSNLSLIRFGCW